MEQIPRKFHLILKNKATLRTIYAPFYERLQQLHPGWELCLYDDTDALQIIRKDYPDWLEQYQAFPRNIQRTDIFRLIVLYQQGGFYLDTDMHVYQALDDLLTYNLVLAEEKTLSTAECRQFGHEYALRIANYMLGSGAGHPFLHDAIIQALNNSDKPVTSEHDVLETTGPGMLTKLYHQCSTAGIHLLENEKHYCLKRCCGIPSCHFGHYAAHLHQGSWRWQ